MVNYKIFVNDKLEKEYKNSACFSNLHKYKNYEKGTLSCLYVFQKDSISAETMSKINDEFNSWGFVAEYKFDKDNNQHTFLTKKTHDNYLCILAPLVLRRYFKEDGCPKILKTWIELMKENPEICSFQLFQLAHCYKRGEIDNDDLYINVNHIFLYCPISNVKIRKLVTLDEIRKRIITLQSDEKSDYKTNVIELIKRSEGESDSNITLPLNSKIYPRSDVQKLIKELSI